MHGLARDLVGSQLGRPAFPWGRLGLCPGRKIWSLRITPGNRVNLSGGPENVAKTTGKRGINWNVAFDSRNYSLFPVVGSQSPGSYPSGCDN